MLSLIILSKTDSEETFEMNINCINSFKRSALNAKQSFEIILVESNFEAEYNYDTEFLQVIKPNKPFNFHKFGNIGLNAAKGDFFIFSNNDVVFDIDFLSELYLIATQNKEIKSFSPYDNNSNKLPVPVIKSNDFLLGYDIQKYLTGWCIVMHHSVYKTIKGLDERFSFYYADNDYAMQLQKYNIKHALVTKAIAKHLEGKSTHSIKESFVLPKNTPNYVIKENWTWVLNNPKMIEGLILFHKKWGSRTVLKLKFKIINVLNKLGLGYFNRFILSTS
jgi:GT2 family glycosyltransferase